MDNTNTFNECVCNNYKYHKSYLEFLVKNNDKYSNQVTLLNNYCNKSLNNQPKEIMGILGILSSIPFVPIGMISVYETGKISYGIISALPLIATSSLFFTETITKEENNSYRKYLTFKNEYKKIKKAKKIFEDIELKDLVGESDEKYKQIKSRLYRISE